MIGNELDVLRDYRAGEIWGKADAAAAGAADSSSASCPQAAITSWPRE
jgi:hypothetical protein